MTVLPTLELKPAKQTASDTPCSTKSTAPQIDFRINYQTLRHTRTAQRMRGLLYRSLIGRKGWPLVFKVPESAEELPQGVSPHLYIHLPFCRQICPHCPYTKTLYQQDAHRRYGATLLRELDGYLHRPNIPPIQSLYFGGGTPTATPDLIERCIAKARPFLTAAPEIGVEVHPSDADPAMLARLKAWGVTRISLGIETFRPDLLKMLARRYTPEQAQEAIQQAKTLDFDCVDVNLLFGIPRQDEWETAGDAKRCLELGADQISAYQLFTFVHTPLGRRVRHGDFAIYGDRTRLRAQHHFSQVCLKAGLERTSPWNFTRAGLTPYSTVTQADYVGFGAGAGSKVEGVFWFNTFSVEEYTKQAEPRPAIVMQTDEKFRRAHWLYWRLYRAVVDPAEYRQLFNRELKQDYGGAFKLLRLLGMAREQNGVWQVTEFGAVWMHRIQQLFSITYIDDVWESYQAEAWPKEVVLA